MNLTVHMPLVVRWMVQYIKEEVLRMSGLVCCSYLGLKMHTKDPTKNMRKLED